MILDIIFITIITLFCHIPLVFIIQAWLIERNERREFEKRLKDEKNWKKIAEIEA